MKHLIALSLLSLPLHAQAENIRCDALFLDLSSDEPVPGYITGVKLTESTITLHTETSKKYVYQLDKAASVPEERSYIGKIGNLPIDKTPLNHQVAVLFVKPEEKENGIEGILTDTKLDTYILKDCKESK